MYPNGVLEMIGWMEQAFLPRIRILERENNYISLNSFFLSFFKLTSIVITQLIRVNFLQGEKGRGREKSTISLVFLFTNGFVYVQAWSRAYQLQTLQPVYQLTSCYSLVILVIYRALPIVPFLDSKIATWNLEPAKHKRTRLRVSLYISNFAFVIFRACNQQKRKLPTLSLLLVPGPRRFQPVNYYLLITKYVLGILFVGILLSFRLYRIIWKRQI